MGNEPDPVRLKDRVAVNTKDRIIEAAAVLFDSGGYHQTSMEDLAGELGVSKGLIYYHFRSKDEILFRIHASFMDRLEQLYEDHLDASTDPENRVRAVISSIMDLMATNRHHVRVFFEHHRELSDEWRKNIRDRRLEFQRLLSDALEEGQAAGQFRPHDTQAVTYSVFGMCNWSYQWFRGGIDEARTAAAAMSDLVLEGLVPVDRA